MKALNKIQARKGVFKIYLLAFTLTFSAAFVTSLWITSWSINERYQSLLSVVILDRKGIPLSIKENEKGHYVKQVQKMPSDFEQLLIKKEDRYFNYHFGVNPFSTIRALYTYISDGDAGGASTITQQLSKNLLGTELERNIKNKLHEVLYSLSLELFYSKNEILTMYANTAYLGNQVQGFETGSYAYFGKTLSDTTHSERLALLATLSYPNARNPWESSNNDFAEALNNRITPEKSYSKPVVTANFSFQKDSYFELRTSGLSCSETCYSTIDNSLSEQIRAILNRHIDTEYKRGARNGAVVVIDPHTSEILALIGTKDPESQSPGDQINMTIEPRPIGSTIKPFLYLKGFMEGLRPYSSVIDREYKYSIATGFPLYPKNFDGRYRGEVTLHESLSNSLNVPTVKVLEFIGLQNFYGFLSDKLKFNPLQSYDSYQYGIALGGLEMDLLTLTHYFTVFPRMGTLEPVHILVNHSDNFSLPPQSEIYKEQEVSDEKFVQLVHAIISDRLSGVDQFGLESNLNIETNGYGVKTGTSRDFHDSWVVGYTGDFVVGVWLGNTENQPLKQITGQAGAGAIWHDTMNLLLESEYNKRTQIATESLTQFTIENSNEWGLKDDVIEHHKSLLLDESLILSPYENDSFEFFKGMAIPLKAKNNVSWFVNGKNIGIHETVEFKPDSFGNYEIMAIDEESSAREIILIHVVSPL